MTTMTVLLLMLGFAVVVFALWRIPRGEERKVVGEGNSFDSYYGKSRFNPNPKLTGPCAKCVEKGCIGAGECRCLCHRAQKK
jgi:hypothetical protein